LEATRERPTGGGKISGYRGNKNRGYCGFSHGVEIWVSEFCAMDKDELNRIGAIILDSAIYVHRALGPGLLESAYKNAMKVVLERRGLKVILEAPVRYIFEGHDIGLVYRADLLVNDCVIVETKSIVKDAPLHGLQILTYLKLTELHLGYLINFNVPLLKQGFRRFVRNWHD
jgi:GxxExxY protein